MNLDTPDEWTETVACGASPGFTDVTKGGIAIARTQQVAAPAAVALLAPSSPERDFSRAEAHRPSRISPGITTGTSRWLAHGCMGSSAGSHRIVTTDQPMIR